MLKPQYPLYVGNKPHSGSDWLAVTDKFTDKKITEVGIADAALISAALEKAEVALIPLRAMASYERQAVLQYCVKRIGERRAEFENILCLEAGKPLRDAKMEVARLLATFQLAAEESVRMVGEVLPLDLSERAKGYQGQWKRVPIGVCSFITPFNFPLNLVAHKIAPALAVGCPFVLKPASATPVSALMLGEILAETKLPEGAFSILPCHRDGAELFTTDERIKLMSFTGSPAVGWALKAKAGKKRVIMELGGNAACIVDSDWDTQDAVARVLVGGFAQSGQSCISVQRVLVHDSKYIAFRDALVAGVKAFKSGDPSDPATVIGPMISVKEAERLEKWIGDAVKAGAHILTGGKRKGAMLEATVVENVPADHPLCAEEAFGPVVVLARFTDFDDALRATNDTKFGLQAGIFTHDIYKAYQAWDTLEVGGVVIGDVPAWRSDAMPYGGVKESGLGREGVRFAMEDMTEIRMFILRPRTK